MGAMQRRKGSTFERRVATMLRETFPTCEFKRASQSDGAINSDVYCSEGSEKLKAVWFECNHSNKPNPTNKMDQAIYDTSKLTGDRIPVVVWRKTGERAINASIDLEAAIIMFGHTPSASALAEVNCMVTIDFVDFLLALKRWAGC
jgi:hypothetical protein